MADLTEQFKSALEKSGIPTTETGLKYVWQAIANRVNLPIANPNKYSAFWVFVTEGVTRPAKWLIAYMSGVVMPNMYVRTAEGAFLDLLAWAYDVERKSATKTKGKLTFSRSGSTEQQIAIPAGTIVRTVPINGKIYRMITDDDAVMPSGAASVEVQATAEESGSASNLAAGYYCWMASDIPGITGVTNAEDYITSLGAEQEPDEQLRLRIRTQFAAVGDWHTDAKYRAMIAQNTGFRPDRIYIQHYNPISYVCRGPGSADAFILFDAGATPSDVLASVNAYIGDDGNHGHGDDMQVKAMPETTHNITIKLILKTGTSPERSEQVVAGVEQAVRCAFRENQEYTDSVTQTWPYSRFSFSMLAHELYSIFPEILSVIDLPEDLVSGLNVPRIGTLTVTEADA